MLSIIEVFFFIADKVFRELNKLFRRQQAEYDETSQPPLNLKDAVESLNKTVDNLQDQVFEIQSKLVGLQEKFSTQSHESQEVTSDPDQLQSATVNNILEKLDSSTKLGKNLEDYQSSAHKINSCSSLDCELLETILKESE